MSTHEELTVQKVYDELADQYDARYSPENCQGCDWENRAVVDLLKRVGGEAPYVFDIGCGTGLLLDLEAVLPSRYFGIDPSRGMVSKLKTKYPEVPVKVCEFEEWEVPFGPKTFADIWVSLFGSPSYIDPAHIERMVDHAPALILMHYVEGYWPEYESQPDNSEASREMALKLAEERNGSVLRLNNFQVTVFGEWQ